MMQPFTNSNKLGNVLIILLVLGLFLSILSLSFTIIEAFLTQFYIFSITINLDILLSKISIILHLLAGLVFISWIYFVNKDLKKLYGNYSMSSIEVLINPLIPIYNMWAIGNIFANVADALTGEDEYLKNKCLSLNKKLPWLFGVMFVSYGIELIGNRIIYHNPMFFIFSDMVYIFLYYIWLKISLITTKSIGYKIKMRNLN